MTPILQTVLLTIQSMIMSDFSAHAMPKQKQASTPTARGGCYLMSW